MAAKQKGAGKIKAQKWVVYWRKTTIVFLFDLYLRLSEMARAIAAFVGAMAATSAAQDCFYNFGNSSFNLLPYQAQP